MHITPYTKYLFINDLMAINYCFPWANMSLINSTTRLGLQENDFYLAT